MLIPVIRKEVKSKWEARTPLVPDHVKKLCASGIPLRVQASKRRVFPDSAFAAAGATIVESSAGAQVVLGIKEPPLHTIRNNQIHLAFSHTFKGQEYNMGLLQTFLDRRATLIDYELMKNARGQRTIAFGRYAGIAGAVDSFHVAGKKYHMKKMPTALTQIKPTYRYETIANLEASLNGLDIGDDPLRVVIIGDGNVGRGCVEVCQWLGIPRVTPEQVLSHNGGQGPWFTVLRTEDVVESKDGSPFDKADYRKHGIEKYRSNFHRFLGGFDILLLTPFWDNKYPKHLGPEVLAEDPAKLPLVIGDISCDINGSSVFTQKESSIDEPAFTYDLSSGTVQDGVGWEGPTTMAISHLPCELPEDASYDFSSILAELLPEIVKLDLEKPLESNGLSTTLRNATIVYRGELTPSFRYLQSYL